jgi:peptidoglycan/xylan/chitin deacetylase (PgdA/CDA1 family)
MKHGKLLRIVAAGMLLAVVAGCNNESGPAAGGPIWSDPSTGSAAPSNPSAPSIDPGGPGIPASSGAPGTPGVPGVPVSGGQTPESVSAALAALPANIRSRVPQFPPPPPPVKVTLPPGDKAPNISRIPTSDRVAFITIDDGWEKNPLALKLFQAANVPITLFLEVDAVKVKPAYFTELQSAGAVIEAHTLTHPNLPGMSYAAQKRQICGSADQLGALYGRRPVLFRPPFGAFNDNTLRAVKDCGMKASFTWKETTDKGKIRFQDGHKRAAPGDIILMHFRPAFVEDFLAVLKIIKKSNLTPALLEDYIP